MHQRFVLTPLLISFSIAMVALDGFAETEQLLKDTEKCGWKIFGHGVLDSGSNFEKGELTIDIDWAASTWGVGCQYTLENPLGEKKLAQIRFEAKRTHSSSTKVFAGVATLEDANLVFPKDQAIQLTTNWQQVAFPLDKMKSEKSNPDSKAFQEGDHSKIQVVKILFNRPADFDSAKEKITLRNPELVFMTKE